MAGPKKCSRCGSVLPANSPGGHCPACLLQIALDPPDQAETRDSIPEEDAANAPAPAAQAGDRIGNYKLLEQIGEGGCGVVYLAEQQEPVRRRVALKVVKLGMDTEQVIARFEAERQALAMMDHPNIAKVLDAGATGSGRPFFVMELVLGEPITRYCDQRRLSTRTRLEVFIDVCRAVQHAHQKGIIHRDIKPSNVLVTEADGKPVPKIIDFGIAKATSSERLTDKTLFTAFQQFIGTPAYMSPEQAGLGRMDVDSRSDIYSLGMLLYELLTSQPAFDAADLRQTAHDEVLRIIREKEPPRPSLRLTSLHQEEMTAIAECRQTGPDELSKLVRGDLDWIAMKALEKDRARRYETADALAMDIQRHLSNEPVLARPPDWIYRFGKSIRRNKLAFAAGSAITLSLVLGAVISAWQAVRALRAEGEQSHLRLEAVAAEKTAQTEAGKSREVANFLKEMLNGAGPEVARGRDAQLLRDILQKTAERLDRELKDQPEVEAELRNTLGLVYKELGDFPKAEAMHRAALGLYRGLPHPDEQKVAETQYDLANAMHNEGRYLDAAALHREALVRRRRILGNDHLDVARSLNGLGTALSRLGKLSEAETFCREAVTISKQAKGNDRPEVYVASLNSLGMLLGNQDKFTEAVLLFREALALQRQQSTNDSPTVARTLDNLGVSLEAQGKLSEAEPLFREELALRRKLLDSDHPGLAQTLHNLAGLLYGEGKLDEAEKLYREALDIRRKRLGNDHPFVASSIFALAKVLEARGKTEEAESGYREALALWQKLLAKEATHTLDAAEGVQEVSLQWARGLLEREKFADAEALSRESLAVADKESIDNWLNFDAQSVLGGSLLGQKRFGEAEPLLLSGQAGLEKHANDIPVEYKARLQKAGQLLLRLYEATDRPDKAARWKQRLQAAR